MKAMKKVLALALALAMVVTAVPVTSAEAATLKAGKSKKITYYVGKTNTVKLSGVKASKVKSTTWSKNGSTAVNLKSKAKTSVKVQVVKAGTAKVTASVKLKSGKTKKYTLNITTKNPTITAASATTVAVDDKISVKATGVKPASATVEYSVVDPAIATVDAKTGEVTGVKAGTTKVTAKLTCGTTVKEVTTDVTVKEIVLTGVKQTKVDQIELTYKGDASKITKDDVAIVRTSDNQRIYTKAVANNATDKKLTVDTILPMKDSKEFTVTVKDSTEKFTATDGKTTSLALAATEIVYGTATAIKIQELDAQSVILNTITCGGAWGTDSASNIEYSIDVTSDKGYVEDKGLVLNKVGDTAKITATKHSGVYKDGKEEGNISFEGTVVAVDSAAVATGEKWTISGANVAPYNWAKVTETHDMILGENGYFFMNAKDTAGNPIVNGNPTPAYTIVSMNQDVLFVDAGNKLLPNKVGTAVLNINDKNGKTIWSYQVTVKEAAKPVSFTLNKANVVLSNSASASDSSDVKANVIDQYGRPYFGAAVKVTRTAQPSGFATASKDPFGDGSGTTEKDLTSDATGAAKFTLSGYKSGNQTDKGDYTYKVQLFQYGKVVYTDQVKVSVKTPDTTKATSYRLLLNGENAATTVDATVAEGSTDGKSVEVKVGVYYDGVLESYYKVSNSVIEVKDKDNKKVATGSAAGKVEDVTTPAGEDSFTFYVRTTGTVVGPNSSNYNFVQAGAGTYTVSVQVPNANVAGKVETIKQYITVKNDQPAVILNKRDKAETVELSKVGANSSNATQAAILGAFEFSYDNGTLSSLNAAGQVRTADSAKGAKGELDLGSIIVDPTKIKNVTTLSDGTIRFFVEKFDVRVPIVLGDVNGDKTFSEDDVVYVTKTVNAGYYLQYK